jgi:hypothetical protein
MPLWAENDEFTAGAHIGTPTKRKPSDGEIAEGFAPGGQGPARVMNWKLNELDRAVGDVGDAPSIAWGRVYQNTTNRSTNIDGFHAGRFCTTRHSTSGIPAILCLYDTGAVLRSGDGESWTVVDNTNITTPSDTMFMISGRGTPGFSDDWITFVVTPSDGHVYVSAAAGEDYALIEDLGSYTLIGGGYYDAEGRYFLGHTNGVLYTDNDGLTWTEASGITTSDVVGFVLPELGEAAAPFILALTVPSGPFNTNPYMSTDGGASWTLCATPPGHTGGWVAGAWNPVEEAVYAINTLGKVYRSTDPLTAWAEVADFGGANAASKSMVQIGRCVVACPGDMTEPGIQGNVWAFPSDSDPLPIAVGNGDNAWYRGGVFRFQGGLVLLRAREVTGGDWRLESAFSTLSTKSLLSSL